MADSKSYIHITQVRCIYIHVYAVCMCTVKYCQYAPAQCSWGGGYKEDHLYRKNDQEEGIVQYLYIYTCIATLIYMYLVSTPHRTNNPAILQLLLSLTGSLHHRSVQDLITRAIATCPDILTPYLQTVALSFEPRPKSKWIDNVEFLTNVSSVLLQWLLFVHMYIHVVVTRRMILHGNEVVM